MSERVKVTFEFASPGSDEATMSVVSSMIAALPRGNGNVRMRVEGVSERLGAALMTGISIGKAQMAASSTRADAKAMLAAALKKKTPEA